MNWDESQMAASAFAKGHGGLSLGDQWSLAAMLREGTNSANGSSSSLSHSSKALEPDKSSKKSSEPIVAVNKVFFGTCIGICVIGWIIIWLTK